MTKPLLNVYDLVLAYPGGPRLGPLSFEIQEGEAFALVGESGAGKSTIALALMDALRFKGGRRMEGAVDHRCSVSEIAFIPQDPAAAMDPLFPIGDQMRELGCSEKKIQEVLKKMKMPLEKMSLRSYPHELSGGMLQRILIGIVLAHQPKLLIADEPTSSLDVIHQAEIMDLFQAVKAQGISIIYITHHLPLAMSLCSKIAVLSKGVIVEQGESQEIYYHPRHDFTKQLLAAVPVLERT